MASQSFVLIPGSLPEVNTGLALVAKSVIVDNYTPNPIIINNDVAQTIPPYTFGVQRNFVGTQNGQAKLDIATSAHIPPIPSVGQIARITFTDILLPATNGVSLMPLTVQVAGAVNIGSSGSVTILGTPNVNVANTPAVTVNSGTINIGNTPSVNIANTPTVILGTGAATVVSISAINSTVTVAGTINIGNTPSVTISGTPTVNIGSSGSVTILGTPAVTISSGTVAISGTPNINISSQSITIEVNHPWISAGTFTSTSVGAGNFTTSTMPVDAQMLLILIAPPTVFDGIYGLQVQGVQSGAFYVQVSSPSFFLTGPVTVPIAGGADTKYKISWTATTTVTAIVITAYESALPPGFPALGQQPQSVSIPVVIANDQAIGRSGQQTMALSAPVTIAIDQTGLPVTNVDAQLSTYASYNPDNVSFNAATNTGAIGAGQTFQMMSLWHTNTSTKKVKLRSVKVLIASNVNIQVSVVVQTFNGTVPNAGVAGSKVKFSSLNPAAEVSCLVGTGVALLNGGGGIIGLIAAKGWLSAAMGGSTSDLFRDMITIFEESPFTQAPILRAGQAEGWNIGIVGNVAYNFNFWLFVVYTEE